jgi:hypothetical protein
MGMAEEEIREALVASNAYASLSLDAPLSGEDDLTLADAVGAADTDLDLVVDLAGAPGFDQAAAGTRPDHRFAALLRQQDPKRDRPRTGPVPDAGFPVAEPHAGVAAPSPQRGGRTGRSRPARAPPPAAARSPAAARRPASPCGPPPTSARCPASPSAPARVPSPVRRPASLLAPALDCGPVPAPACGPSLSPFPSRRTGEGRHGACGAAQGTSANGPPPSGRPAVGPPVSASAARSRRGRRSRRMAPRRPR